MGRDKRIWIQLIVVPLLFYGGAKLSLIFAVTPDVLVVLWIPNSIVLAALLHFGTRRYGYFAAAILLAEIAADYPTFSLVEAACFGAINLLEATLAYGMLRRWRFDPRFDAPADIAKFVVAGPILGALASAFGAAVVYSHFRGTQTSFVEFVRVWWFSDGLGLLILTPLVLSLWPPVAGTTNERSRFRWYDGIAAVVAFAIFAVFALSEHRMFYGMTIRAFLLIPPVLYAAVRFNIRVTTSVTVAVAALVLYVTKNGQEPFGDLPIRETIISVQELLFVMSTMSLSIAALLAQHRANAAVLESRVVERTAELSAANERLAQLALTDALTGLLNRRALFDLLRREVEREKRYGHAMALIVFDIDHFKQVNDRHGHAAGDFVLQRVASIAGDVIRHSDAMARYGGEEFVVVAPETDDAQAVHLAERIRTALRSTDIPLNHHVIRVTASFGVASLHPDDATAEDILRRADRALYRAKASGRDCVVADLITGGSADQASTHTDEA